MEDDLERCGMQVFRVCAFHMSAKIASKKPALVREAMGIMLADCFHYQVDYITRDANMACYRTGGSKQGSTSFRDSCFQEMVRYYLKAYDAAQSGDPYCCPKAKFCASNPLTLLRWMEDKFGVPWKNVGAIDWQSIPSMDCMVACILEWAHTIPMERWSQTTDPTDECKVRVSEWLLRSNGDVCMLPDSDSDSHAPLLVHLTPSWMSNKERRALRNPETLKASHDSRRERQRAKKRGDPAPSSTETPGTSSTRPAEPEHPPSARESVQLNLPILLQAKERGSDQLNLQIRRRGRARRVSLRKARRATLRRASPRKALRRAPPTRARPRTSATARARARSEAARVMECFFLRRNPHYALFLSSFFTTPMECISF